MCTRRMVHLATLNYRSPGGGLMSQSEGSSQEDDVNRRYISSLCRGRFDQGGNKVSLDKGSNRLSEKSLVHPAI